MTADIIRRFLWMVPVLLMVTVVTFGAMKEVPGGAIAWLRRAITALGSQLLPPFARFVVMGGFTSHK